MRMSQDKLNTIVEQHRKWLTNRDGIFADFTGVNLVGCKLTSAALNGAKMVGTNLLGVRLDCALLIGTDLTGANLKGASLIGANLTDANFTNADLTWANLACANLTRANLTGAVGVSAPAVPGLDAKILDKISQPVGSLNSGVWCDHGVASRRAVWAIILAGDAGRMLEDRIGPGAAGALIYAASRPGKLIPNFYESAAKAMEDMKRCAAEDSVQPPV